MGEVYRARDTRLHRDVAVKTLPEAFALDPDRVARFEREARAVAALSHPNILAIHDVGAHAGVTYLVMELLEGETLRERLARGALPVRKALEICVQLASGLAAAHDRGIVHRDLKPENIFLTRDGRVKILDFGLAKTDGGAAAALDVSMTRAPDTTPGTILGTVGYMAPEQVRGLDADHRADIFAVGAMLYEMIAGRPAFKRDSAADTLSAVLKEDPPPLDPQAPAGAPGLARVIRRCLEKEPRDRFGSARDLGFAIESLSDVSAPGAAAPTPSRERSVAVLPFTNMSAEPDAEYFSDGLAEELINALAKLAGLRVASRTSAFRFRGRELDIRQIGRELNVETVIEGSVRRSGKRLRVSAQLVNVADGYQLWSERYDREMADVFDIQDEITSSIVATLQPTLLGQQQPSVRRHSDNVAAFELYLKGRHFWHQRTKQSLGAGIACFRQAIELDPDYALAHAGLADSYAIQRPYGYVRPDEAKAIAEPAARRAIELDPTLSEAHFAMALCRYYLANDWGNAEPEFRKAVELAPHSSMALVYYGFFLATRNRFEEAEDRLHQAMEADPLSPFVHGLSALTMYVSRKYEEAIRLGERTLELYPDFVLGLWGIGCGSLKLGRHARAMEIFEKLVSMSGRAAVFIGMLGLTLALAGRQTEARALIDELIARSADEYVTPPALVMIYLGLDEPENLRHYLEASLGDVSGSGVQILCSPFLDDLWEEHGDVLRRLGMAEPPR